MAYPQPSSVLIDHMPARVVNNSNALEITRNWPPPNRIIIQKMLVMNRASEVEAQFLSLESEQFWPHY
jgi:hypothetical protein